MARGIVLVLVLPLLLISCKVTVAPVTMPSLRPSGSPAISTRQVQSAFEALGASDFRRETPRADDTTCKPVFERATFTIPSVAPAGGVLLYCGSDAAAADAAARFAKQRPPPPYLSVKENIVLRLDERLTSDEAERYRIALEALR